MAVYHGKDCQAKFNDVVLVNATNEVTNWELRALAELIEVTTMGDDWKRRMPASVDFSATTDMLMPVGYNASALVATSATLALYIDDTHFFSATAICTKFRLSTSGKEANSASLEFEGNSVTAIAYA